MTTVTSPRVLLLALAVSAAGHVVHNLAEFPPAVLLGPETLLPLAVTVALGAALWLRPGRPTYALTGAWALLVLVVGGGSVVPVGVLPFVPEQSASHYAAHLAYALAQVPLLWVAGRGLRGVGPTAATEVVS